MKKLVFGILAHVDAGKTTLSEGLLYTAGVIDKLGRVDKQSAYMDTHDLERERGITIFSKQATFEFLDTHASLIDTPGHVDFVAEAERALAVQDYAILVVSATEGVEAHTKTLWQLISSRGIPTFIFVNKTDIARNHRARDLGSRKSRHRRSQRGCLGDDRADRLRSDRYLVPRQEESTRCRINKKGSPSRLSLEGDLFS